MDAKSPCLALPVNALPTPSATAPAPIHSAALSIVTPPVGMNLFSSCIRFNKPVVDLYRACIPFIIVLLAGLLVITYVPWMSLWLIEHYGIR